MNPEDPELDRYLTRPLSGIAGEQEPPPSLEDRVVAALRRTGSIVSPRRSALRLALVGALAAGLAIGFLAGRWSAVERAAQSEHFLLFVLNDIPFGDLEQERRYYDESAAWTEKLEREGHLLSAARLASARTSLLCEDAEMSFAKTDSGLFVRTARMPSRHMLSEHISPSGPSNGSGEAVLGYFLIRARDEHEAMAVARESPHLRYGGGIEIWRLVGRP